MVYFLVQGHVAVVSSLDLLEILSGHRRMTDLRRGVDCMLRTVQPRIEHIVRDAINNHFDGFIHNKVIPGAAHEHDRRIDHRLLIDHTILAIEADEKAHQHYNNEDEQRRYWDFMSSFPHKFVFIRFNPDDNMEKPGRETSVEHKISILIQTIREQMHRIRAGHNIRKLEVLWLFY